jgi:hypothetical protein
MLAPSLTATTAVFDQGSRVVAEQLILGRARQRDVARDDHGRHRRHESAPAKFRSA